MSQKKFKTRKSIAKRIKITKTGKVLFRGSHVRHLRRKKNKGQVRNQKIPKQLKGAWKKKVKKMLGR